MIISPVWANSVHRFFYVESTKGKNKSWNQNKIEHEYENEVNKKAKSVGQGKNEDDNPLHLSHFSLRLLWSEYRK